MIKYLAAYVATAAAMLVIDMLWLAVIAKPLYKQGIRHLMADRPNIPVAALFYAVFPIGLIFCCRAGRRGGDLGQGTIGGCDVRLLCLRDLRFDQSRDA
jgi:uncharacterized membrane protein